MGAEDETLRQIYLDRPRTWYLDQPNRRGLEWVLRDISENTPWFFYAEWFDRIAEAGYITFRRAKEGEILPHRSGTRTSTGGEVVATMTEKGREWWRAHAVAERLRGAT